MNISIKINFRYRIFKVKLTTKFANILSCACNKRIGLLYVQRMKGIKDEKI